MNFTENALNQFKKLIHENESPNAGIRFYTTQGCCSPMLQMNVAENLLPGDTVLQMSDVNIFITPEADKILSELTLDYADGGFKSVKAPVDAQTKKCC